MKGEAALRYLSANGSGERPIMDGRFGPHTDVHALDH
jgi:hypothetical protein